MNGFIPAYHLIGDLGYKIGAVKGMPIAWNSPTILSKIMDNPECLLVYDSVFLDARSYELYYNNLEKEKRIKLKNIVENERLGLFELINIDATIETNPDINNFLLVRYNDLYYDSKFIEIVRGISSEWGNYANPSPYKFEAMNIPLIESIRNTLNLVKGKELQIIDHPLRAPLYGISMGKNLSGIFAPEIASTLLMFTPKIFNIYPDTLDLNIEKIIGYKENEYFTAFRKKVSDLSDQYSIELMIKLKELDLPSGKDDRSVQNDHIFEIEELLTDFQSRIYIDLERAYNEIRPKVRTNKWSMVGGVIGFGSAYLSTSMPGLSCILGVIGSSMVITEQIFNQIKKKKLDWTEFIRFLTEQNRKTHLFRKK